MWSHDGAEICELVGFYLLNQLGNVVDKSYGISAINNANGAKVDRVRKDITALIKKEGLSMTIETNLIETNFLDVSFNLVTGKYFPFRKANNTLLYINTFSNHPPTIIKQLPKVISKRISDLLCKKKV